LDFDDVDDGHVDGSVDEKLKMIKMKMVLIEIIL
jgi:hypothetical protein